MEQYYDKTFYKERWIKENDLEQRIIVNLFSKISRISKKDSRKSDTKSSKTY